MNSQSPDPEWLAEEMILPDVYLIAALIELGLNFVHRLRT